MKFLAALTTVLMLAVYLAATGLPTKVTYVPKTVAYYAVNMEN